MFGSVSEGIMKPAASVSVIVFGHLIACPFVRSVAAGATAGESKFFDGSCNGISFGRPFNANSAIARRILNPAC